MICFSRFGLKRHESFVTSAESADTPSQVVGHWSQKEERLYLGGL